MLVLFYQVSLIDTRQPTYGRFKYSQASPEEQEALNRKFQAQQEFKVQFHDVS